MKTEKKKYTKPTIKRIKLVPEEAVLAACKTHPGISRADGSWRNCSSYGAHHTRCYNNSIS